MLPHYRVAWCQDSMQSPSRRFTTSSWQFSRDASVTCHFITLLDSEYQVRQLVPGVRNPLIYLSERGRFSEKLGGEREKGRIRGLSEKRKKKKRGDLKRKGDE